MKGTTFMILGCATVIGAVLSLRGGPERADRTSETPLPQGSAERRSFDVLVAASGELDAARAMFVSSTIPGDQGRIVELAPEGTRVAAGDVVVRLDPAPFDAEVERLRQEASTAMARAEAFEQVAAWERAQADRKIEAATLALRIAELDLRKLEHGDGPLESARLEIESRKVEEEVARYRSYVNALDDLEKRGYPNAIESEQARHRLAELEEASRTSSMRLKAYSDHVYPSELEKSRSRLNSSRVALEQEHKESAIQVAKAIAASEQARQESEQSAQKVAAAERVRAASVMRAPIPGMVVYKEMHRDGQRRKPRVGDTVYAGQPLVYIPDVSAFVVRTRVREVDLHRIHLGAEASVRVGAYPDATLKGTVSAIGVLAESDPEGRRDDKWIDTEITIQDRDARLRPGLSATATIVSARVRLALSVPVTSLFEEGGRTYCWLRRGRRYARVDVSLGAVGDEWAEVRGGVPEGAIVALATPSPGQRLEDD